MVQRNEQLPGGDPSEIVRRAPFSDNPQVGVRGQRAQQRILEAALQVFGELGYHQCGISRITEVAGCSRASFYQYFSSKEDVFRHLAGQVARQLNAAAEALDPITPDTEGWETTRAWIDRHAAVYVRYEPVFQAFQAAAESDEAVAGGSARISQRQVATVRAKVQGATLPDRNLDPVLDLLLATMTRTRRITDVLRAAVPSAWLRKERVNAALADVIHRTLFGLDKTVNVQAPTTRPAARIGLGDAILDGLRHDGAPAELTPAGSRTLTGLLDAAHGVLVARGYHATRVDDITEAAGVSHGAFYRYFENKDHLVRQLAFGALQQVSSAFTDIPDLGTSPDPADAAALRRWLRRYGKSYASEAAMIRVWIDATADDPKLSLESAASVEWGRARLVRFLEPRRFGDIETEALLLVAILDAFGAQRQTPELIEATALLIERGFLGHGARRP